MGCSQVSCTCIRFQFFFTVFPLKKKLQKRNPDIFPFFLEGNTTRDIPVENDRLSNIPSHEMPDSRKSSRYACPPPPPSQTASRLVTKLIRRGNNTRDSISKPHKKRNSIFLRYTSRSFLGIHWNLKKYVEGSLMLPRRCLKSLQEFQRWSRQEYKGYDIKTTPNKLNFNVFSLNPQFISRITLKSN